MGTPKKLPFAAGQASGYDELSGANPAFINAIPEGDGFRVRPGLVRSAPIPSSFPSTAQVECIGVLGAGLVYVTSDRKVFWMDTTGHTADLSTAGGATLVDGTTKPMMYASSDYCFVAGGGAIQHITAALESRRLGAATSLMPRETIGVAMNTKRVLAIVRDSNEYYWSGEIPVGIETWETDLTYDMAQARPDWNVAIADTANEVWIWGKTTTQLFVADENWVYTPAVSTDVGCAARDSVVRVENRFAWLDDKMRFQLSNGRVIDDTTDISKPLKTTLESLTTTSDCWGFRARMGQHDLLFWVFPTVGKTFCYDIGKTWSEVRGWRNGRWQSWYPTAYCWWPDKRMHVVGLPDGTLAEMTFDSATDLGDPVPWRVRTGFQDHGTSALKTVPQVLVRARGLEGQPVSASVQWRDDLGSMCWPVSVEGNDHTECNLRVEPVGEPYEGRQYELAGQADGTNYVSSVTEDVVLEEG